MRKPSLALFAGIGRHAAWMVVGSGLAVLVLGLLLHAGSQQRQYRDMHQQQMRQLAAYHTFDVFANPPALELAERICELAPLGAESAAFALATV